MALTPADHPLALLLALLLLHLLPVSLQHCLLVLLLLRLLLLYLLHPLQSAHWLLQ
jgi:hypothetical protein